MSLVSVVSAMVTRLKKDKKLQSVQKMNRLKKDQKKKDGCQSDAAVVRKSPPDPKKSESSFKSIL